MSIDLWQYTRLGTHAWLGDDSLADMGAHGAVG